MKIISNNPVINRILEYVKTKYHAQIDCPWYKYPNFFVIRGKNRKWFGLIMKIPYQKLHINKEGMVDIINVRLMTMVYMTQLWTIKLSSLVTTCLNTNEFLFC